MKMMNVSPPAAGIEVLVQILEHSVMVSMKRGSGNLPGIDCSKMSKWIRPFWPLERLDLQTVVVDQVDVVGIHPRLGLLRALPGPVEGVRLGMPPVDGPQITRVLVHALGIHVVLLEEHLPTDVPEERVPCILVGGIVPQRIEDQEQPVVAGPEILGRTEFAGDIGILVDGLPPRHGGEEPVVQFEPLALVLEDREVVLETIHQFEHTGGLGLRLLQGGGSIGDGLDPFDPLVLLGGRFPEQTVPDLGELELVEEMGVVAHPVELVGVPEGEILVQKQILRIHLQTFVAQQPDSCVDPSQRSSGELVSNEML